MNIASIKLQLSHQLTNICFKDDVITAYQYIELKKRWSRFSLILCHTQTSAAQHNVYISDSQIFYVTLNLQCDP